MTSSTHRWRFFRAGGFDQVRLDRGADLANLAALDQKLWVALSCPVQGIEFDPQTLALIDVDADGHIRAPELIQAIDWAVARLTSPDTLVAGGALALSAIGDATLAASARRILDSLGKTEAQHITVDDCADNARIFAGMASNGDGVITPTGQAEDVAQVMAQIMATVGSVADRSGEVGINRALVEQFFAEASVLQQWRQGQDHGTWPLGEATPAAFAAWTAVRDKINDFFMRCQLAAFDPRAGGLLNGSEDDLKGLGAQLLACGAPADMAKLPLAFVSKDAALPLSEGLNPAWVGAVKALNETVLMPLLGQVAVLTARQWADVSARFQAYEAWVLAKPQSTLESLPAEQLDTLLQSDLQARLLALVADDEAAAAEASLIGDVDRLVRYVRDLARLANNFVSFTDFYTRRDKASFQVGTLYMDGRSADLCVKVLDSAKHATLAALSGVYLVYCDCVRGAEKMTVAAAFTAGDSDQLMVGRNGVFYDREGRDWDATITKIIDHPISIRQSFWTPYKKVTRLIGEQVQKFAAAKAKAADEAAIVAVTKTGEKVGSAQAGTAAQPPAAPSPFDAAKFAGIFAAVGLAVGAIGTAVASVVTGFLNLKGWQMPLALIGLMLMISGPAMAMAFFKLRNRNLGPILDANGWAVNTRARINIPFGTALTQLAKLPEGAERSLTDPYAEKKTPWKAYLVVGLIVGGLIGYALYAGGLEVFGLQHVLKPHQP